MTEVVAGIIEKDGRILICQRRADQPHAGKWEFPGGKIEAGESPEAALRRELREELAIEAKIGAEMLRYEFAYPQKKPILLIFFPVTEYQGEMQNRIFAQLQWCAAPALGTFDLLEGDAPFLEWLTARRR